jgi:hypothetical protein
MGPVSLINGILGKHNEPSFNAFYLLQVFKILLYIYKFYLPYKLTWEQSNLDSHS